MGKTSEAAVYRKFINSMKKKTKAMKESAVMDLEKGLLQLDNTSYDSIDNLMTKIADDNDMSTTLLHNQFKTKITRPPRTKNEKIPSINNPLSGSSAKA